MNDTLVIIPAFNEEQNIATVIRDVRKKIGHCDLLIVNDGSVDHTARILRDENVDHINLPFHMGYGVALQTGYKYAVNRQYHYVVQIDGDGQHAAQCINDIITILRRGNHDVVLGSRFKKSPGTEKYQTPLVRHIGIILLRGIVKIAIRKTITDPTSGFIGFNRTALSYLVHDEYPHDYPDADVIIALYRYGLRIKEIPVTMYGSDKKKGLHSGLRPLYYVFKMSLAIFISMIRREQKIHSRQEV